MTKVMVALSGGVDSSTTAYILQQQGYEVAGVTLKLHSCADDAINDAKKVCDVLKIKHYVLDLQKEFAEKIIENFSNSYLCAKTPNPCIICNEQIKFGLMLEYAINKGYDYLATGHYAVIEHKDDEYKLKLPKDLQKDQTYFLYRLSQKQLAKTKFPLGNYTKQEIRVIAQQANLPVASKKDSQEICFIKTTYKDFLQNTVADFNKKVLPGLIVDKYGKKLGKHKGLIYYTIGQRSGLGITTAEPVYVLKLDIATNTVIVGTKQDVFSRVAKIEDIKYISDKQPKEFKATVKIRRQHKPSNALISGDIVLFDEPQASITPGQSAVFYDGEYVLGGGFIAQ